MYSDLYIKKQIKIPTWVFILVIFSSIFFMSRFFSGNSMPSKANQKNLREFRLVNIAATRAGVFWQTEDKETGWLILGESETNLTRVIADERDLAEKKGSYHYHYALVKDLQPNKNYFFKIVSDKGVYSKNGKAYQLKTTTEQRFSGTAKPAYGKIFLPNNQPAENVYVILTYVKSNFPLLSQTKASGEWLIPLNSIASIPQPDDKVKIEFLSDMDSKTTVEAVAKNLSPLPQTLVLGKDYTFLNMEEVLGVTTQSSVSVNPKTIDILYPKEDALIAGASPLLKGLALPNQDVSLELVADKKYYFKPHADKDGVWKTASDVKLPPGKATLILTAKDEEGKEVKIIRSFSIAKSGEQVLGVATGSASITPTSAPTVTIKPTAPLITVTPVPTLKSAGSNYLPFIISGSAMMVIGLGVMFIL